MATVPVIEAGDITSAGYTGPPTVSSAGIAFDTVNPGDLTIWHLSTDTGNADHTIPASGPGGSVFTTIEANVSGAGAGGPITSIWYSIASVTATASTFAIQLTQAIAGWGANTIRVPAGEFNSSAPIQTNFGSQQGNATATASSPAWTTDAPADGRVVIYIAVDTQTVDSGSSATGYTNRYVNDHGRVGTFIATRDAGNTSSESIAGESWGLTGSDTFTAHGYVVNAPASAPPAGTPYISLTLMGVGV